MTVLLFKPAVSVKSSSRVGGSQRKEVTLR